MIWLYQTVRTDNLNQQEIDNTLAKMGKDKPDGWELVTIYNGLAYFKKPDIRAKEYEREQEPDSLPGDGYSYETVQGGYVIYNTLGQRVDPWRIVKLLDIALEMVRKFG